MIEEVEHSAARPPATGTTAVEGRQSTATSSARLHSRGEFHETVRPSDRHELSDLDQPDPQQRRLGPVPGIHPSTDPSSRGSVVISGMRASISARLIPADSAQRRVDAASVCEALNSGDHDGRILGR